MADDIFCLTRKLWKATSEVVKLCDVLYRTTKFYPKLAERLDELVKNGARK